MELSTYPRKLNITKQGIVSVSSSDMRSSFGFELCIIFSNQSSELITETVSVGLTCLLSCARYDEEKQHKALSNRGSYFVLMASL